MKFSRCPVFTVKSVSLVAIGLVVVGATYFVYNKMSINLLVGTAVIVLGTYLSTSQTGLSYKDEIIKLRREKQEGLKLLREANEEQSDSKVNSKIYGKGRVYFTNKKKQTRENYVRNIVESIFRQPFPSKKPIWLVNPNTGRRLELDCYNEAMRLSFECDGIQHSQYLPHFHKCYQRYLDMKDRDILKNILVKKRGICLIRIPHHIPDDELESYILTQIHKNYKI